MVDTTPRRDAHGAAPRVVMLVGNDITTDNRVLRSATTLARAGADVTIIGYSPRDVRYDTRLGDVHIVRVPVGFEIRDARVERRTRRRSRRLPGGYATVAQESAARRRLRVLTADLDRAGTAGRIRLSRAAFTVRVRSAIGRRVDRATVLAWKVWDKAWSSSELVVRWRNVVPEADDYEVAFGPVIDSLHPDVIHAHDVHVMGVAERAAARARARGEDCRWVYDAHEWVSGLSLYGSRTRRVVAAWADHEREFIHGAARVVTVSEPLARALAARYRLKDRPAVVLNIPPVAAADEDVIGLRATLGLSTSTPLAVYSGGVQAARGVQTAVAALPLLPELHLAVVAVPHTRTHAVQRLVDQASALGVSDRLHLLEPVPPHLVSSFLASADVGLIPLLHFGSHEMALANKLFEYLHADIPSVVSDCLAQKEFVERYGIGVVHRADDPVDLARAVTEALARADELRAAGRDPELLATYTWEGQEDALVEVYRSLQGWAGTVPSGVPFDIGHETVWRSTDGIRLGIGPANSAGQGWAWAKAVERNVAGVSTEVVAVIKEPYDYGRDIGVVPQVFARDVTWQSALEAEALSTWTHALLEAGRGVFGTLNGRNFVGDTAALRAAGVTVGLVFHGSEIRDPRAHAATHAWSPFSDASSELTARLQRQYDALAPLVADFDGPKFVSTPDLLDYVPDARWLPLVIDTSVWTPQAPPLERAVPVVVHAPSHTVLKGTQHVESVLQPLADRGLIDYRRIQNVAPSRIGTLLADADVVIDQMLAGSYGVLACEGVALGRVVVGYLGSVRAHVGEVPILEATPDTLGEVMARIFDDRESVAAAAATGPAWIAKYHDGRMSAQILNDHFLATES